MAFRYKKEFGQHFLRQVPKELLFPLDFLESIQTLQKSAKIGVIEIGPGGGVVTKAVLEQLLPFSKLDITYTAVDIDPEALESTKLVIDEIDLPKRMHVNYVHKDVLTYDFSEHKLVDFLWIFGSLPYNISKKIVNTCKHFSLNFSSPFLLPSRFVLQLEVAEDYISNPTKAAFLGSDLSLYAKKRRITKKLPGGAFTPPPNVESAILEVEWSTHSAKRALLIPSIAKTIRTGFTAKRKAISSQFKKLIPKEKITPTIEFLLTHRAHELTVGEWELITQATTE
jgi:16S rRNA (adenine1518-N6/adenine1519-N6)-dimethyltransferase